VYRYLAGKILRLIICVLILLPWGLPSAGWAQQPDGEPVRQFNDVLTDLLDEFAYDLKSNQIALTENLALRKVNLSQNIPASYEKYLETMVSERIRTFSRSKVVHCPTCRVKQSVVKDGRVTVVMPINNKRTLDTLAKEYGIAAWMDVGLIYQTTSMILAFNVFDARSKELLWSKVYNSETIYQKFPGGVPDPNADRDNLEESEPGVPASVYNLGLGIGWALVPNVNESVNMIALSTRLSEVFNQKQSEVGAQITLLVDTSVIVPEGKAEKGVNLEQSEEVNKTEQAEVVDAFKYGVGVFGTYHHNFYVTDESLDLIRPGVQLGLGALIAEGYLAFTAKFGGNLRMGRSLCVEVDVLYSAPTSIELGDGFVYETKGGVGALATFGFLF
jgi:hypothetical protein